MMRVWQRPSAVLALASGAAFAVVMALYRSGALREIDRQVALQLKDVHGAWLDTIGNADDILFRPTPTFAAAAVVAILLWRFGPRWSWCAPLAIVFAVLAEVIVKNGLSQVLHLRSFIDGILVLAGGHYHAAGSFPSGHVTRALFLAVIALSFLPRIVSIPFTLFALTTLLARLYTEAHRVSDVLGGATLGIFIGCATVWGIVMLVEMEADVRKRWRAAGGTFARRLGGWASS
jgi:membrane-associated phospholipid phosphatase